jgi:hypothetical protein
VDGGDPRVEFAIDPAKLRAAFAADLSPEQTALASTPFRMLLGKLGFTPDAVGTISRERIAAVRRDESEGMR